MINTFEIAAASRKDLNTETRCRLAKFFRWYSLQRLSVYFALFSPVSFFWRIPDTSR